MDEVNSRLELISILEGKPKILKSDLDSACVWASDVLKQILKDCDSITGHHEWECQNCGEYIIDEDDREL